MAGHFLESYLWSFLSVRNLDQEVFVSHLRIKVLDQAHISPALSHMDETWALCFVTWNSESQERNIILPLDFSVNLMRNGSHFIVPLLMGIEASFVRPVWGHEDCHAWQVAALGQYSFLERNYIEMLLLLLSCKSCLTLLWYPLDCSPRGFSVHGTSQAKILQWVAISFSSGSSQPRVKLMSLVSPALQANSGPLSHLGRSTEMLLWC